VDAATARARLERMVQAAAHPRLDDAEIAELLELGARPDLEGVYPSAAGWAGAWDLHYAAAEGWRWKAAKVAGEEQFTADGLSTGGDAYKACLAMAAAEDRQAGPPWAPSASPASPGGLGSIPVLSGPARTFGDARLDRVIVNLPEAP
jgi:hypothetical protein